MENMTDLLARIEGALSEIRPFLKVDGGDIEVIGVSDEGIVQIKWLGNCQSCSMSPMTMKGGIEQAIKSKIPEIKGVEAVNGYSMA